MSGLPSALESVFQVAAALSAAAGLVYVGAVATVAAASVLFRSPQRRRDARATLTILLRRGDGEQ
ncbi:hypothetical protein ABZ695_00845 [Streptomyces sp. NPDC006976]|uniref:hypothetical protein n=1 Tax=Streptomyces sp. NPDC006976 TaxID=3154311 RepID=UPI0033C42FDA